MDSFYYTVFPNFHPWLSYNYVVQNFRPYNDRHDMCTFDLMYLRPFKGERPPPAKPTSWARIRVSSKRRKPARRQRFSARTNSMSRRFNAACTRCAGTSPA